MQPCCMPQTGRCLAGKRNLNSWAVLQSPFQRFSFHQPALAFMPGVDMHSCCSRLLDQCRPVVAATFSSQHSCSSELSEQHLRCDEHFADTTCMQRHSSAGNGVTKLETCVLGVAAVFCLLGMAPLPSGRLAAGSCCAQTLSSPSSAALQLSMLVLCMHGLPASTTWLSCNTGGACQQNLLYSRAVQPCTAPLSKLSLLTTAPGVCCVHGF